MSSTFVVVVNFEADRVGAHPRKPPQGRRLDNEHVTPAVFAHVIVGNTYNYTAGNWLKDITLAASKGIDAFALNVGSDNWEPSQVANAFAAAGQYNANRPKPDLSSPNVTTAINGTNSTTPGPFKLFMSFDMGSLPCSSPADAQLLQTYIKTYANNTNQMMYNGRMLVSTFAGESCTFGANSLNQGWMNAVKPANASLPSVWFVPSFFVDPSTFSRLSVIDGAFHWNSAWPMGNYNVTFAPDLSYINNLGNRTYMASVAPWFFTHYGPQSYNKNFIYRGDDWLFAQRWELLVQNRTLVPLTQVLTWNDFGESHYLGPIEGMQPQSQAWVNGFDHQPWLDLMQYYIAAYKTGSYPAIGKDRVFLWGRLYPTNATTTDPVAKPDNWPWTQDYLWSVALLTSPANVTLSCGTSSQTTQVPAGLAKLKLRLSTNCAVKAVVTRNSATVLSFSPAGFNFNTRPSLYNYNAFVAASPA
ncbi:glycoside hydrolase family 71 protein [Trametes coccinea BRFM310]|uniref:Glycoside hydrolase family 71 protein n=1 Tax=Trametes coccinea (strain BRFM310) TaxID=1353009 RepID=A0A1Y2J2T4_TRAC3|nr:glycoside hydrolase family 71 protein [Trametes coccinea BRFM310]